MQTIKIIAGLGVLCLLFMTGMTSAAGAAYCNISNATIAAMCANLTQVQANLTSTRVEWLPAIINVSINTNSIKTLQANQTSISLNAIEIGANVLDAQNAIVALESNSINASTINAIIAPIKMNVTNTIGNISALTSEISSINANATGAKALAIAANANASDAESEAKYAVNRSNASADVSGSINSSINQKTGILNTNITTIADILKPINLLNLTGTYSKTQSQASSAGWKSDLALLLVVILIIVEVARIVGGRSKKPKADVLNPQMVAEANAKADKYNQDQKNAEQLAKLQKERENLDDKVKIDKLNADPEYKPLKEKLNKDIAKAKKAKLDMDITTLPSYKALQAKTLQYGVNVDLSKVEKGNSNG